MRRSLLYLLSFSALASATAQQPTPPSLPAAVTAAVAPGSTAPLSLAQVLDLAHRGNPTLLAGSEHVSAVRANEQTASQRQNPVLVLGGTQLNLSQTDPFGPPLYQAGIQRLFERGSKRQWRLDTARSTTDMTAQQLADTRRQLDLQVRQAFARMLFAQAALEIARANLASYQQTVNLQQVRLDAGDIDRTDFERVELQLVGFETDADNATLALGQGSIALQTLLGIATPTESFAITGSLDTPAPTLTLADLQQRALDSRPDLKAAEAQVRANEAATRLARANGTADPTLEGEYERSGGANTLGANLNLPLRLFDRNQGEKERTRYEAASSRLALTAARNQVIADVQTAWAAYNTALTQNARYQSKYLSEAAHVRDNLEFSYRHGNSTLLDYLSALSSYRQVNLAALNAQLQLQLALEQLSTATNTEVAP